MTTVLIVDDLPSDLNLMAGLLSKGRDWTIRRAENGRTALDQVRQAAPDVVVTDLRMPEMDGLELVEAVKQDFPHVPVILVTSRGSEETAAEALRRGASSYVPKNEMARHLQSTVDDVLQVTSKTRQQSRLMGFLNRHQRRVEFAVENDRALIPTLVGYLQDMVAEMGICQEAENLQVGMALDEALVNALYHGNLEVSSELREGDEAAYYELAKKRAEEEPYRNRRIFITAELDSDQAVFVLRDEGPGFDPNTLPDPTDPENLIKVSGRGILLMRTFMDDVQFNEQGNEVTLVKRRGAANQRER